MQFDIEIYSFQVNSLTKRPKLVKCTANDTISFIVLNKMQDLHGILYFNLISKKIKLL